MIKDYFKLAIKNVSKRKLRSSLTLLGIIISIAIIFIIVSLSLGLQGAIQEQFKQLGTDKFFIQPLGQLMPGSTTARTLTTGDVDTVEKVNGIDRVSYFVSANAKIESDKQLKYFSVYGLPKDGMNLYLEAGSLEFDEGQEANSRGEIMIGSDYKKSKLFDKPLRVGSKILINEQEFKVSGIFTPVGNSQDDRNIIMFIDDFKELFNSGNRVDYIIVQVKEGEDVRVAADNVDRKLRAYRDVTEKTRDFTILTPEELLKSFQNILNIITYFLVGVAAISLLVGAVGIANTMYTSVLERTREIGIMKAIGARNNDILLIFLIESGLIGAIGGILGVLIGVGISKSVEYIAINQIGTNLLRAAIPSYLIIGCILFSFIIGAVSGVFPARHASRIKTVDALRYE